MSRSEGRVRRPKGTTRGVTLAVDGGLLVVMAAGALLSGSLTIFGETIRSALILARDILGFLVRRRADAGFLTHYDFGTGKLERSGHLAIALAMGIAGLWLAGLAVDLTLTGDSHTTAFEFALAASALAPMTLRSGLAAVPYLRSAPDQRSMLVPRQLQTRILRFVSLLVVQLAMTLAALFNNQVIATSADVFGAIFVALLLATAGARLFIGALSDLIDHPLDKKSEARIARLLVDAGIDEKELHDLRSRRSGSQIFLELTIRPMDTDSFEASQQRMVGLQRHLTREYDDLDLSIKLHAPEV